MLMAASDSDAGNTYITLTAKALRPDLFVVARVGQQAGEKVKQYGFSRSTPFQASLDVLLGIATVVLAVAAFSWWIVPLALAGAVLLRRQLRGIRERQPAPPASAPVA